jgi:hypothetical protein
LVKFGNVITIEPGIGAIRRRNVRSDADVGCGTSVTGLTRSEDTGAGSKKMFGHKQSLG